MLLARICTAGHICLQHSSSTTNKWCRCWPSLGKFYVFLHSVLLLLPMAGTSLHPGEPWTFPISSPVCACFQWGCRYEWLVQREVHMLAPSPNWRLSAWETWEFLSLLMNRDICTFLGRWPPGARGHPKVKQFPLSPPIETLTRGKLCCSLRK